MYANGWESGEYEVPQIPPFKVWVEAPEDTGGVIVDLSQQKYEWVQVDDPVEAEETLPTVTELPI